MMFAISLRSVTVADDGGVWASLTPQNDQVGLGSALHVLQNLPNVLTFADILSSLRCSSPQPPADGQSRYSLPCPGHLQQIVSELVTAFLGASAYPSQHGWLALPDSSALRYMQSQGFVLQGAASNQLSQDGLNSLVMYVHHGPTSFVSQIALEDPTLHQHIQALEDRGWTWARLPNKKRKANQVESEEFYHEVGGPKVWRTSGSTVHLAYLKCLMSCCEQLQTEFGIDRIPHGRAAAFYEKLLKGQMEELVPLPALEDDMAEGAVPHLQPEAAQQPDRNAREIGSVLGDREVEDEEDLDFWIDMLEEQLSRQQFEDVAESAVVPAAPAPEEDGHGPDPEPDSILPAAEWQTGKGEK